MTQFDIFLTDCQIAPQIDEESLPLSPSTRAKLSSITSVSRRNQCFWARLLLAKAAENVSGQAGWLACIEEKLYPVFSGRPNWYMSLSHSGSWIAAVVSYGIRVGVDLECLSRKTRNWQALIQRVMSSEEVLFSSQMPISEQVAYFCKRWTLREAAFKAGLTKQVLGPLPGYGKDRLYWETHPFSEGWITLAAPLAFRSEVKKISW